MPCERMTLQEGQTDHMERVVSGFRDGESWLNEHGQKHPGGRLFITCSEISGLPSLAGRPIRAENQHGGTARNLS